MFVFLEEAEFETVLYSVSPSLHDRKRTYRAFPFFPRKKRKHFCRSRLKDAILETHLKLKDDQNQEQCRSITQHIMYKVFWLTKNGFLFCNVTLTFRKYLRETLKISNSEDLNRLTACSLVLLGNAFLCQGITQVHDYTHTAININLHCHLFMQENLSL